MGRTLSLDLRERVAGFVMSGASRRAAARRFGVSASFAVKLMQRQAQSGSPAPKRLGRPRGGRLTPFEGFLIAQVEKKPDITMPELAALLLASHGVVAAPAVLSRLLCRLGFTYKKSASGIGVRTR
jgi:transposase